MSDNCNPHKEARLDDFLRNFADWDRPGFDLDLVLKAVEPTSLGTDSRVAAI